MKGDGKSITRKIRRVVRASMIAHAQQGILNVVAIDPFGVGRVEDKGAIDHEFVAVQAFRQLNIDGPDATVVGHCEPF